MSASARGTLAIHSHPHILERATRPAEGAVDTLVVCTDFGELQQMLRTLNDAGYATTASSSFEEARRLLRGRRFDLLVTSLRLRTYNGLSLVLFGRVFGSPVPAIVIDACPDRHNATETERLGATYLGGPPSAEQLVASAVRTLRAASKEQQA